MRLAPAASSPLLVNETFVSLQGEGALAGYPCFFIRLTGCNLRCGYCDTRYAYEGGEERGVPSLKAEWRGSGVPLVQVTGGEPLLQPTAAGLMRSLVRAGAAVVLETNGSLSLADVPKEVVKVVDRKTPGSGMSHAWLDENLRWLGGRDQIKFVLTGRGDYLWAREQVQARRLWTVAQVLFSPAWGLLEPPRLAEWVLEDRLRVRFQIQLHKFLWGEKKGK